MRQVAEGDDDVVEVGAHGPFGGSWSAGTDRVDDGLVLGERALWSTWLEREHELVPDHLGSKLVQQA